MVQVILRNSIRKGSIGSNIEMDSSKLATARKASQSGSLSTFAEIVALSKDKALGKVTEPDPDLKRIIVCCDGTWNCEAFPTPLTNVSLLSRCIMPSDAGITQVVFYQPGIGTGTSKLGNVVEGATGRGSLTIVDSFVDLAGFFRTGAEYLRGLLLHLS